MIKKVCTALSLLPFAALPVSAGAEEEAFVYRGVIEAGVQGVDVDSNNSAKFQEYRDLDDGFIGSLQFDALKGSYFFQLDAANPGLDDQSLDVHGGRYGKFKYNLYFDEMPHNYSFNARSFYRGLGTNHLVVPADPTANPPNSFETSTDTWSVFDYSVQHKKYGGEVEVSLATPYYITFGVERREQDGMRPYSVRENIEAPQPISYTTDNLNLKAGYLGKTFSASISGYISSFDNDYKYLLWDDPSPTGNSMANVTQNAVTDPDNNFSKLAADFSWRGLPLKSALAMSASYANLSNSVSANEINVNSATMAEFDRLNRTNFDGDIDYTNFSAVLVSEPVEKLDTRLYYRYLERENNSSRIFYSTGEGDNARELLSYDKNTAGAELGYRLPYRTKANVGYEYENIDRSTPLPAFVEAPETYYRYDKPESTTNDTFFAKLKNNWLGWLSASIKYKHLKRDSDFSGLVYDPYQNVGVIRFDAANKTMDEVKLGFEFSPFDRLDFGVDCTYQMNDYDNSRESRTDDERKNIYFDVAWRFFKKATLSGFVGFEHTETDANRITNLEDDLAPVYAQYVDDDYWTYGLALTLPDIVDKLTFKISWQYQKSDGSVEYNNSLTGTDLVNIEDSDDYTKQTLEARAIYAFDANWSVTVGYLYEKFKFSDIAYANYQYILDNSDYYSGVYYDQNYTANLGYVILSYKF
ncbi:MtrB/PioB family outer membrane beta-barrel protein [Desulfobulbus elongatus]|uniref:MtrB/PioB family outer membrane beta-barrel protein n=1 Tax=Desulfobulbus elongatus TaxID=53332 RepID=UPI000481B623|nr:MtrB/PioB family outer membrane beta-barrel protein [Desulfobulbus elongatus]